VFVLARSGAALHLILLSQRRYRRGKNIAKVAAARKLLILVYYGLRDGQIRALARSRAA
jgi:hypothetical protein